MISLRHKATLTVLFLFPYSGNPFFSTLWLTCEAVFFADFRTTIEAKRTQYCAQRLEDSNHARCCSPSLGKRETFSLSPKNYQVSTLCYVALVESATKLVNQKIGSPDVKKG